MAEFVHQYVDALLRRQESWASILGVSILTADRQTYAVNLTQLALIGVVMKRISELVPTVTDQVWLNAVGEVTAGDWPEWIVQQLPPDTP